MISIIIPVYNAAPFLDHSIESIIQQTYNHWELILINDGSTDNSGQICDNWAKKDKRISVIHQKNKGVSATRNAGIKAAKGEYILFLDSDDALRYDTLEVLMVYETKHQVDCIIFGIQQDNGQIWAPPTSRQYNSFSSFLPDFGYWLNTELLSPPWNKLYKKTLINNGFPNNISFGEDLIFCLSYLKHTSTILFITDRLYLHNNLNPESITHTFKKERIYDIECWQHAILDFAATLTHSPDLYIKYFKDLSFYLKKLYGCKEMYFSEKKKLLKSWYPQSILRKTPYAPTGSRGDKLLFTCVRHQLWLFSSLLLQVKSFFYKKS